MVELARRAGLECRILPGVTEILLAGDVRLAQVRDVQVEDLLRRTPFELDLAEGGNYLSGRTVLVTGAGGSIGSELVRQAARLDPKRLVLLGQGENSLHSIEQELRRSVPDLDAAVIVGNVQDGAKMREVMGAFGPDVVFHAAAHKQVPLLEHNPDEAVLNNVGGTRTVARAALEAGVERFVNISTDKAVEPISMLGVTKAIAERVVLGVSAHANPGQVFVSVRFGNVLGSRGSVVPIFQDQILRGGPVTLTDPAMTRYFMTIPEASRLVIQAGSFPHNGAVYVLDMGAPVRIEDLARDMIRLSGRDDDEIDVVYTGLRPGEKLAEALFTEQERTTATRYEQILIARSEPDAGGSWMLGSTSSSRRAFAVTGRRWTGIWAFWCRDSAWASSAICRWLRCRLARSRSTSLGSTGAHAAVEPELQQMDLREFLRVVQRRKVSVVLVIVLVVGVAMLLVYRRTPVYSSTARVEVRPLIAGGDLQGFYYDLLSNMDTEAQRVTSRDVATIAGEQLGVISEGDRLTVDDLATVSADVSTTIPANTTYIDITCTTLEPAESQACADAFATAYVSDRESLARRSADAARQGVEEEIAATEERIRVLERQLAAAAVPASDDPAATVDPAAQADLADRIDAEQRAIDTARLQLLAVPTASPNPALLALPASLPAAPSNKDFVTTGVLATIVGLALGIGVAFARERLDERVGRREGMELAIGAPVLAVVPRVPSWRNRNDARLVTIDAPDTVTAEAYRTARTTLMYLASREDIKVLVVTGPGEGEGKTTTTANLATALAQAGKHVVVVSADLRKPRLRHFFGLDEAAGLPRCSRATPSCSK